MRSGPLSLVSFSVVAGLIGVFALRGSARAARNLGSYSAFLLAGSLAMPFLVLFYQPAPFVVLELRLWLRSSGAPIETVLALASVALATITLWRLPPAAAGGSRIPAAACGVAVGTIFLGILLVVTRSEPFKRAEHEAAQKVGHGYRFHVRSISISRRDRSTHADAIVHAWGGGDRIESVRVAWNEP
ncbi:MAG: hypothetical protein LC689_14700 [Myxococcales bacterium]|nr:hypothetical protein [Myxococcales bacterium]